MHRHARTHTLAQGGRNNVELGKGQTDTRTHVCTHAHETKDGFSVVTQTQSHAHAELTLCGKPSEKSHRPQYSQYP